MSAADAPRGTAGRVGAEPRSLADGRTLRDLLADDDAHLVDGAMGTMLYERGVFVNVCYDALVLEEPELIRQIHAEYVTAGAELVETNTFGANPVKLSAFGLER